MNMRVRSLARGASLSMIALVLSTLSSAAQADADGTDTIVAPPSGHTTMAYLMGAVLAHNIPAKASAIMARAAVYGQSRIVCEEHSRSDVTDGEALGLIVAAREELTKAGLRT
jgi:hypothetical protein